MAKGKELRFLSVYMLYRTFNIFDQPTSLDLNYHKYQWEFHLLQMEFKQVTNFIDKEVTPLRDHLQLDGATQRKTTDRLLAKLSRIHAALV